MGILKVDTERSDFAVLQGMGQLTSAVVMIEFWEDLPGTVGPSVYQVSDVAAFMAKRGYSNFVVIKRHDQFEVLQVNSAQVRSGDWGNVVFVHDSAFARLGPVLFKAVASAQSQLIDRATYFAGEAEQRWRLVEATHTPPRSASGCWRRPAGRREVRHTAEERQRLLEEARRPPRRSATPPRSARLVEATQQTAEERQTAGGGDPAGRRGAPRALKEALRLGEERRQTGQSLAAGARPGGRADRDHPPDRADRAGAGDRRLPARDP